jgi:integrase
LTRTTHEKTLSTLAARLRLKARVKPHWSTIDAGIALGYRKTSTTGAHWCVRQYLGDQKYSVRSFAIADDHVSADGTRVLNFQQARRRALELSATQPVGPYSVGEAMESYFKRREQKGAHPDLDERRCEMHILPTLGSVPVDALTTARLEEWLAGLVGGATVEKIRASRASANRTMVILKAGLNMAFKSDKCASNKAWAACEPFADVNKPRLRFFSMAEVTRLLNAAGQSDFGNLCRAALFSGIRYGDLCKLTVGDFDQDSGTIYVLQSKTRAARRIVLTSEGIGFFTSLVAGRAADAPMLTREGKAWAPHQQSGPMTKLMQAARVEGASFHIFRHSHASHLLMAGCSMATVSANLGHASILVTERHYAHLSSSYRSDQIRGAGLDFGTAAETTIVPFAGAK